MSITVFLAICVLGCDFLLYVLFQWNYGEKRRKRLLRSAGSQETGPSLRGKASSEATVLPFPERAMQYRTGYY